MHLGRELYHPYHALAHPFDNTFLSIRYLLCNSEDMVMIQLK